MSEYAGADLPTAIEAIVWRLPLAQAFALYAAISARYQVEKSGPTYVESAMIRAKRRAEQETAATF